MFKERFPNDGYLDVYEKNGLVSDRCLLGNIRFKKFVNKHS